jgi:hypothetical protein
MLGSNDDESGEPGPGKGGTGEPGFGQSASGVGRRGIGEPGAGQPGGDGVEIGGDPGDVFNETSEPGSGSQRPAGSRAGQRGAGPPGPGKPGYGQPTPGRSESRQPGSGQAGSDQTGSGDESGDGAEDPNGQTPRKLPFLEDGPASGNSRGSAEVGTASGREPLPQTQSPLRHRGAPSSDRGESTPDSERGSQRGMPGSGATRRSILNGGGGHRSGSGGGSGDDSRGMRWGSGGSTIGLEQDVKVHVYLDRIIIGENRAALGIALGESKQQVVEKVSSRIEQVVADWGEPPKRFHWLPRLRFIVHPGGNQHYERLKDPIKQWGLSSTVEFSLDGPKPLDDPQKTKPNRKP